MADTNHPTHCPFCNLPEHRIISERPLCLIVRDGYPVSPGHTLIIPKRHVASLFAATADEQQDLLAVIPADSIEKLEGLDRVDEAVSQAEKMVCAQAEQPLVDDVSVPAATKSSAQDGLGLRGSLLLHVASQELPGHLR